MVDLLARAKKKKLSSPNALPSPPTEQPPPPIELEENDCLLRMPEVLRLIPVSRSTIWRLVRAGELPRPLEVSKNAVAWPKSQILKYLNGRQQKRASR